MPLADKSHTSSFSLTSPGVRTFVPKPVATNLQYVGGAAAILGLVAMASDVEGLYAAVKALVCVVKSNPLASKEMERIKGYQVGNLLFVFYFILIVFIYL